jgi:hypothetical protein
MERVEQRWWWWLCKHARGSGAVWVIYSDYFPLWKDSYLFHIRPWNLIIPIPKFCTKAQANHWYFWASISIFLRVIETGVNI